jgi:hypothetical protein
MWPFEAAAVISDSAVARDAASSAVDHRLDEKALAQVRTGACGSFRC